METKDAILTNCARHKHGTRAAASVARTILRFMLLFAVMLNATALRRALLVLRTAEFVLLAVMARAMVLRHVTVVHVIAVRVLPASYQTAFCRATPIPRHL